MGRRSGAAQPLPDDAATPRAPPAPQGSLGRACVARLLADGDMAAALGYAASSPNLARCLVEALAARGRFRSAGACLLGALALAGRPPDAALDGLTFSALRAAAAASDGSGGRLCVESGAQQLLAAAAWSIPLRLPGAAGESADDASARVELVDDSSALHAMRAAIADERAAHAATQVARRRSMPFVVGVDAEWRPDGVRRLGGGGGGATAQRPVSPVALLQLATPRAVYLVDVQALDNESDEDSAFDACIGALFRDGAVLKVGAGLGGDLLRLAATRARLAAPAVRACRGGIDLGAGVDALDAFRGSGAAAGAAASASLSLSSLCERVLGAPLDKSSQLSDWSRRPLTQEQLRYAALDASAALHILLAALEATGAAAGGDDVGLEVVRSVEIDATAVAAAAVAAARTTTMTPRAVAPPPPPPPPRSDVLAAFLRSVAAAGSSARIVSLPPGSAAALGVIGVAESAAALGVSAARIVKSLAVILGDGRPALAVLRGDCRLDLRKLASVAADGDAAAAAAAAATTAARLASVDECVDIWGYSPGTFPPLGHRCLVFVDARLAAAADGDGELFAGAGAVGARLALMPSALVHLCEARVGDIATAECAAPAAPAPSPPQPPLAAQPRGLLRAPATAAEAAAERDLTGVAPLLPPPPRFLCDGNLGRLTRWLRVCGVDAEATCGRGADAFLAARGAPPLAPGRTLGAEDAAAFAAQSGRLLVTTDRKLALKREPACSIFFLAQSPGRRATLGHFLALSEAFHLVVGPDDLMARCAHCNGRGYDLLSSGEAALCGSVPAKLLRSVTEFWRCRTCSQIYWSGAKMADTRELFAQLLSAGGGGGGGGGGGE